MQVFQDTKASWYHRKVLRQGKRKYARVLSKWLLSRLGFHGTNYECWVCIKRPSTQDTETANHILYSGDVYIIRFANPASVWNYHCRAWGHQGLLFLLTFFIPTLNFNPVEFSDYVHMHWLLFVGSCGIGDSCLAEHWLWTGYRTSHFDLPSWTSQKFTLFYCLMDRETKIQRSTSSATSYLLYC